MSTLSLRFLGVGNAAAVELGSSACVLLDGARPTLLIDCGPDTLHRFQAYHPGELPPALFVTHVHLDHVGGIESLFYRTYLDERRRGRIKVYVPVALVAALHGRLAGSAMTLAEGGANFWDAFQLVPVGDQFWHENLAFRVFPVRHHGYLNAFGIALSGAFLYTGDTKPIPELVTAFASHGETVFHDCGLRENPSHTAVGELAGAYAEGQRERLVLYHYESPEAGRRLEACGYRVAHPGDTFALGWGAPAEPLSAVPPEAAPTAEIVRL